MARVTGEAGETGEAFLASYASVFFRAERATGALLAAATLVVPRVGIAGAAAVVVALVVSRMMRLPPALVRGGYYGYSALLAGLGIGAAFEPNTSSAALLVLVAGASVPITAAVQSWLGTGSGLPALALPFLAVTYLAVGAGRALGLPPAASPAPGGFIPWPLPGGVAAYLSSLGSIFYLPRPDAGLIVLGALLAYSRIAVLLSGFGFAAAWGVLAALGHPADAPTLLGAGVNAILTAVALGGIWFVPSAASFALAGLGVAVSDLIAIGARPYLERAGLPLLVLPFNAAVLVLLYAMRQRTADGAPKAVDFTPGSPEENLAQAWARARLGLGMGAGPGVAGVRIRAPFSGRWVCTQGPGGALTHHGAWRHAFDFEVPGRDGRTFSGDGLTLEDHHAYRVPVLAAAAGTVVRVVDGVPDSPVGRPNLEENWGNLVVIHHAVGLFSLTCHFSPGTITVREGQIVRAGETLGRCGSSGRSAVPHIHFQLQATAAPGAPTIPVELHDVVIGAAGSARFLVAGVPAEGDRVRNLEPEPELVRALEAGALTPPAGGARVEAEIDLFGRRALSAPAGGGARATLLYEVRDGVFTVQEVTGPARSIFDVVQVALPRAPLECREELTWEDHVPAHRLGGAFARAVLDLVSPFAAEPGLRMSYRSRPANGRLIVEGTSLRRQRSGVPVLRTRVVLEAARGLTLLEVSHRGRRVELDDVRTQNRNQTQTRTHNKENLPCRSEPSPSHSR